MADQPQPEKLEKLNRLEDLSTEDLKKVIAKGRHVHLPADWSLIWEKTPADKAYLSNDNLDLVAKLGATPFIPFKSNSTPGEVGSVWERMYGYFTFRRPEFLKHYHARSNVESTFSMVKAKFQDAVRSKTAQFKTARPKTATSAGIAMFKPAQP